MPKQELPGHVVLGYDAKRAVSNGTGLGSYSRTLLNDLAHVCSGNAMRLYVPALGRDNLRGQLQLQPNQQLVLPRKKFRLPMQRSLWRSHGVVADMVADGVGLYHGLSGELPVGLKKAGIAGVVTIHDLIFLRHPEYYHAIDVWLYKRKFKATLREASRVIAISQCTKRDILAYGDFPEDRIDVVYQSCGQRFSARAGDELCSAVRQKYQLPQLYVLNVGTIETRKNVLLAVQALQQLPTEVSLVVVGRATPYAKQVLHYAQQHGLAGRVKLLHGVPNDELAAIYQMASVFVYPSRYEGFGIPIIEAIQCGLPVVACTGSCLEEAGGPDCAYVAPDDSAGMAGALRQLLDSEELRRQRVERSRSYVARFENTSVAAGVLQTYRKALGLA